MRIIISALNNEDKRLFFSGYTDVKAEKGLDGYLRVQTDEDGKIVEIWDYWYKDEELELYMDSCGVDCYLEDYTFTPNSLILITFKYKSDVTESYMHGREYDEWLEIVDEIVLIENYNHENLPDDICDYCGCHTEIMTRLFQEELVVGKQKESEEEKE